MHVIKSAPLAVGEGKVESSGWKAKNPGVFMEVFRDQKRLLEVGVV